MGFSAGSVSFCRFAIDGPFPHGDSASAGHDVEPEWLSAVRRHAFGRRREVESGGLESGWLAPTHLFDTDFSSAQRLQVGKLIHLAMRIDRMAPPGPVVRSYVRMEEQAIRAATRREELTRAERRAAREAARERLQAEVADGRYRRMAGSELLIDPQGGEVLFGNVSASASDKLMSLFRQSFGVGLTPLTFADLALGIARRKKLTRALDDLAQTPFVRTPVGHAGENAAPDRKDRAFLAEEFLTWLWHHVQHHEGAVDLPSAKTLNLAFHGHLELRCPFGVSGRTVVYNDAPAASPEARAALSIGKRAARAGLFLESAGEAWSLTLRPEPLHVQGLKIPPGDTDDPAARLEERMGAIRTVAGIIDQVVEQFLMGRLSSAWPKTVRSIARWVQRDTPAASDVPAARVSA